MKRKLFLIGMMILAVASIGLAFAFAPFAVSGISLAVAGAGVTTTIGTKVTGSGEPGAGGNGTVSVQAVEEANANILRPEVVEKVVLIQPSATPLDTILRMLGNKKNTNAFEVDYFSSGVRDIQTTVHTAVAETTSQNSAKNKTHTLVIESEDFCDDNETLMLPEVMGGDNLPLCLHVFKHEGATLTVMAINGTGTNNRDLPAIAATKKVIRIGNAMNELDAKCNPFAIIPEDDKNYVQIVMSALTQGEYEKTAKKDIKFELDDIKEQVWYDFRRKRELMALFSKKDILYYNGKQYYHTDGIITQIARSGRTIDLSRALSVKENLTALTNQVFNGNNGASSRYMFCGSGVLDWISNNVEYNKMMEAKNVEIVPGLIFNKIETNYGNLNLKLHPDFDNVGWKDKFLIIDPANINIFTRRPMRTRKIDNIANGTELSTQYILEEAFCVNAVNPDTHCIGSLVA